MKKQFHSLYFEAFEYPTEDREKVLKAVSLFLPKGAEIKKEKIESFYGPEILKLTFATKKNSEIQKTMENILKNISKKDKAELRKSIPERLNDDGDFYMRFDKQKAFEEKAVLSYHGDVVKIVVKMAAYPFSRKTVEKTLGDLLA